MLLLIVLFQGNSYHRGFGGGTLLFIFSMGKEYSNNGSRYLSNLWNVVLKLFWHGKYGA
jgi:hypothetical protein